MMHIQLPLQLDWASRNSTVSLVRCTYKVVVRLWAYWVILRALLPREQVFEHKVAPCIIVLVKTGFTFCLHGMHRKQWSVLHSIKHMKHSNVLWWWRGLIIPGDGGQKLSQLWILPSYQRIFHGNTWHPFKRIDHPFGEGMSWMFLKLQS